MLQQNVDAFIVWCDKNGLEFNTKKCFSIRFGCSHRPNTLYSIKGQALELVDHIKDLGVKRFSRKFSGIITFRTLYFSYIYSVIVYASLIWSPKEKGLIK